ncbi:MAG: choice-of-anchor V domain-containing protein [Longimicrobiales bacterium]
MIETVHTDEGLPPRRVGGPSVLSYGSTRSSHSTTTVARFLFCLTIALSFPFVVAYKAGPPAGHTGGFGEPTCIACHADNELDPPGGSLEVRNFPEHYTPGGSYVFTVHVGGDGMGRAGYQLSVRTAAGERAGENAGTLAATDPRTSVITAPATGVLYAQHVLAGIVPLWKDSTEWAIRWTAPPAASGTVILHVAANAANYDDSEYGDRIYHTAIESSGSPSR